MDIGGDDEIAAQAGRRARGRCGARSLLGPGLGAALTLGSGCGIRAMLDHLDEDKDGVMLGEDCDEQDATIGSVPLYVDWDGDGHGVPPQVTVGCEGETGLSTVADDCDDDNLHIWQEATWFLDNDRDGYGVEPGVLLCASEAVGYALQAGDCLDDDPGAWPGAPTSCDGDDNDCDGQVDPDCELPSGALSGSDADWLLLGTEDAQLGAALAPAGDVDCDGLEDLLVGAPGAGEGEGAVVLAYGAEAGLSWTLGEEREGVAVLTGEVEGGGFGAAVAGDVDVDGDGCADLVVGAPWVGGGGVGYAVGAGGVWSSGGREGRLYVAMGPWFAPSASAGDAWGVEALSGEDGGELGTTLACGEDVLGDGAEDCLVGAPTLTSQAGLKEAGAIYLLSPPGLAGGSAAAASVLAVEGSSKAERLGSALAMGDLNADGMADLALGASTDGVDEGTIGSHATMTGRVYVIHDVPPGTYDAEGLADTWIEGAALDGTGLSLSASGDLDADGYDDLAVGAPYWDLETPEAGRLTLYSGATVTAADGALSAEDAVATLVGAEEGAQLAASVALLADMSDDGRAEVLVGVPGAAGTRGAALLFLDAMSGTVGTASAWLSVEGSADADMVGRAVTGVDLNGLGRVDTVVGGSPQPPNTSGFSRAGLVSVVYMDAF